MVSARVGAARRRLSRRVRRLLLPVYPEPFDRTVTIGLQGARIIGGANLR